MADVAVFVTRFSFFGQVSGFGGLPFGAFEVAIAVRTLVLLWCVASWLRRPAPALPDLATSALQPRVVEAGAPA